MNAKRLLLSLLAALVAGGLVLYLALLAAHTDYARSERSYGPQHLTRMAMSRVQGLLRDYYNNYHRFPNPGELQDLLADESELYRHDAWGHPFVVEGKGSRYRLISYGRDGKPGGEGLDYDLIVEDDAAQSRYARSSWVPDAALPTMGQFLTDPKAAMMRLSCVLTALLAAALGFLVVFLPARRPGFDPLPHLLGLAGLIVAATFFAAIITGLHVPWVGH